MCESTQVCSVRPIRRLLSALQHYRGPQAISQSIPNQSPLTDIPVRSQQPGQEFNGGPSGSDCGMSFEVIDAEGKGARGRGRFPERRENHAELSFLHEE